VGFVDTALIWFTYIVSNPLLIEYKDSDEVYLRQSVSLIPTKHFQSPFIYCPQQDVFTRIDEKIGKGIRLN
jgi:hypothetical protein